MGIIDSIKEIVQLITQKASVAALIAVSLVLAYLGFIYLGIIVGDGLHDLVLMAVTFYLGLKAGEILSKGDTNG